MKNRYICLDILKTIAILSVIFYHMVGGYGYLGVEIFFVVSGYLFVAANKKKIEDGTFSPKVYILKRIAYFGPLILVAGIMCLMIGHLTMLPDDYEGLAQSVVASNFFSNNILLAITSKNYWDIVNLYKPLMHFWYIGVLIQCLCFLAITIKIGSKIIRKKGLKSLLVILTLVSFFLYIIPLFDYSVKFYYFPFRLFEFTFGGLLAYISLDKFSVNKLRICGYTALVGLVFVLCNTINYSASMALIITILLTAVVILCHTCINEEYISKKIAQFIALPGKFSFDLYIWHQIIIAFLAYSVFATVNIYMISIVLIITCILTIMSIWMRKIIGKLDFTSKSKILIVSIMFITSTAWAMNLYINAGVVRNVPELGINKENVHRHMHAEYVDVPYAWNQDFSSTNKRKILVVGNSYARDFANILNESKYKNKIEISYNIGYDKDVVLLRADEADIVFYSTDSWIVPDWILESVDRSKLYIVGNKRYGISNGIVYSKRKSKDYFEQTAMLSDEFISQNNINREVFGEHYIDMISPVLEGNLIKVFTDDGHFISQDCRHLTSFGAKYYSEILELDFLVKE